MTPQEELFIEYVAALRAAKATAEGWWTDVLHNEELQAGSGKQALKSLRQRWPFGPAAHPCVIHVLRKYWLACLKVNTAHPEDEVYPHVFTTEWLLDGENDELAEFINDLPYWPVGQDESGNYV